MLRKIDSCACKKIARKSAKTVGKDSSGAYIVSSTVPSENTVGMKVGLTRCLETERQPYTDCKLVKLPFLKMRALAVHSNMFPYFTDLTLSSSL